MLIVTRNGNTVADNYACVVCTYVCVRSGGASPSNQPGHFQVTTVVKQVIPSLPFLSLLPPLTFSSHFPPIP